MDFKNFKKNRKKLNTAVKGIKDQNPKFKKDERFWMPTKDSSGSANALIRFLPQADPNKPPIVSYFQHGFKEKGKWFIENCPSTHSNDCPSCEYAQPLWDEDTEESRNLAQKYSRTKQFVSNILVIKDLANPENDGKVFLYKFGIRIYEKIEEKIFPESELDDPVQVFDFWEGCGFKLKLRQKHKRNNYDQSSWASVKPVASDDKTIEKIYNQLIDLDEFIADDKFKPYDELLKKFNRVMKIKDGVQVKSSGPAKTEGSNSLVDEFDDPEDEKPKDDEGAGDAPDSPDGDDDFNFDDTEGSDEKTSEPDEKSDDSDSGDDDDFNFDDNDDDDFNFEDEK
jgi:hypothetical protein